MLSNAAGHFDAAIVRALASSRPSGPDKDRLAALERVASAYAAVDPGEFYAAPLPTAVASRHVRALPDGGEVVDLSWHSGYVPHDSSVRARFAGYIENSTAQARLLRHATPRPALVCIHGYRAGAHRFEEIAWSARWLHGLGLDVALLQLPFHALRAPAGHRGAPLFPSVDAALTVEALGQAVRDARSLLSLLRARGSPMAGVAGMSLGAYTAALLCTVEKQIDYGVFFIPLGDLTDVVAEHETLRGSTLAPALSAAGKRALTLVRPLAREPLVPGEKLLVVAAQGDRITAIGTHGEKLAAHFGAPLVTMHGGHLMQIGRRSGMSAMARLFARVGAIPARAGTGAT